MTPNRTTIIAGGGASGALLANALLREDPAGRVIVVEPRELLGTGMAYATKCPVHLLNVPAARMSAIATDPDHFVRWLAARYPRTYAADSFVPRMVYGEYLNHLISQAQSFAPDRFVHVRATATAAQIDAESVRVSCTAGIEITGSTLVLACGNAQPAPWPGIDAASQVDGRFFSSAWEPQALNPRDRNESVVLLGTGLTAVDAVLGLRYNGHRGTIHMISRRGLLPHEHRIFDAPLAAAPGVDYADDLPALARTIMRSAKSAPHTWRASIDRARPRINELWRALSVADRRRFVRHVMPYWNIHRHRMAPQVVKELATLISRGTLQMIAGRTGRITTDGVQFRVPVRLRGTGETRELQAHRIVNCSGPLTDVAKLRNPLIDSLLEQGILTANALRIGIEVDENGAPLDSKGLPSERVFTIGPMRFGALIETTAIPEIRVQAAELAERLAEERRPAARKGGKRRS